VLHALPKVIAEMNCANEFPVEVKNSDPFIFGMPENILSFVFYTAFGKSIICCLQKSYLNGLECSEGLSMQIQILDFSGMIMILDTLQNAVFKMRSPVALNRAMLILILTCWNKTTLKLYRLG